MSQALLVSNLVLWVLVLALAAVVAVLARRIGQIHEQPRSQGTPTAGQAVAPLVVRTLDGSGRTIGGPRADGRSTLVLFLEPGDPGDEELPSALQAVRRSERDWLDVVLAIAGEPEAGRRYLHDRRLTEFPGVLSVELAPVFRVTHPRSAALIDADGLLRSLGIVVSRTDLEGLVRPPGRSSAARRG